MTLRFENLLNESDSRISYEFRSIRSHINGYEDINSLSFMQLEISDIREQAFWAGGTDKLNEQLLAIQEAFQDESLNRRDPADLERVWNELGLEELWDGQKEEIIGHISGISDSTFQDFLEGPDEKTILESLTEHESGFRGANAPAFQNAEEVKTYYQKHYNDLFQARAEVRSGHEQNMAELKDAAQLSASDEIIIANASEGLSQHIARISAMSDLNYNKEDGNRGYDDIPEDIKTRLGEIFSGPLEEIGEWNQNVADQGHFAHILAYTIQDFRNSDTAEQLAKLYEQFHENDEPGKQLLLEERMREMVSASIPEDLKGKINEDLLFETMFQTALRPPVFDPFIDPKYEVKPAGSYPEAPLTYSATFLEEHHTDGVLVGDIKITQENGTIYFEGDNIDIRGNTIHIEGNNNTSADDIIIESDGFTIQDGKVVVTGDTIGLTIPDLKVVDANNNIIIAGKNHSGKADKIDTDGETLHRDQRPWLDINGNSGSTTTSKLENFEDLIDRTRISKEQEQEQSFNSSYYVNHQPNFKFINEGEGEEFFKTYLGEKGTMFFYADVDEISLTPEQLQILNSFFGWDRNDPTLTPPDAGMQLEESPTIQETTPAPFK